ncbi:MAG: PRD domain-containing protein [Actinobacteria bacterium]|nr:PRD domain-containing protein [Actinomycetota bacterium]
MNAQVEERSVGTMRVKRVISNNAVLALDDGHEVVALGRGLGTARRPGEVLEPDRIEQVFVAGGDALGERLTQFLADVPLECVRAAARIADLAGERLGIRVTQSLILPVADHLQFALYRHREGSVVEYPLRWEVAQLYPDELAVGRAAVELAGPMLGIPLDPNEAVALALHVVNAQFAGPGLSKAVEMTETITQAVGVVEQTFGLPIDEGSINVARFVTHLRYLFSRVAGGKQIADPQPTLAEMIGNAHPDAMACAAKVQYLIEMRLATKLTPDETAYLALHIARLVLEAGRGALTVPVRRGARAPESKRRQHERGWKPRR